MSQVTNYDPTHSLTGIMDDIDLGPTSGVQMMFAKLQLAQSQLCKNQAESYMKQIEDIFWEKGYRNLKGNKISHVTMSNVISNPKYKGY